MAAIGADPSVSAADGTCFFDKLPREIRDEIYSLAYMRDGECTLVLRRGFSSQSGGRLPVTRSWKASSGVTRFLICKQWHTEALPQYFRHNRIHCRSADDLHGLFGTLGPLLTEHLTSLRLDHDYMPPTDVLDSIRVHADVYGEISHAVAGRLMVKHDFTRVGRLLGSCTHLSHLVVDVRAHFEWACFEVSWSGAHLSESDFWKWHVTRRFLALINDLKELRGLQDVQIRQKPTWLAKTVSGALGPTLALMALVKRLSDTMRVFEAQVRAQATKPRVPSTG